jgi:hypothetical protein
MGVEDCRRQLILRKVKLSDLENGSRRSRLAHGCKKNRDGRLGGLISRKRRGERFANNYGVEEWVAAARDCSSFESREVLARKDPRGNSALWIRYPWKVGSQRKEVVEYPYDTGDCDSRAANAMPRVWIMPAAASRLKVMGLLSSGSDMMVCGVFSDRKRSRTNKCKEHK